jgi:hypothetical protein
MKPQDHAEATKEILGEPFLEVHQFMDRYAPQRKPNGDFYFDKYHRKYQHHLEGVELVRETFGDIGALVAKLHIWQDTHTAFGLDHNFRIAKDRADFVREGLV